MILKIFFFKDTGQSRRRQDFLVWLLLVVEGSFYFFNVEGLEAFTRNWDEFIVYRRSNKLCTKSNNGSFSTLMICNDPFQYMNSILSSLAGI
jgi:hypothetical protein